ncbi:ABC transporter permease [Allorhizocola rhizosphaerae]|uniref:ABC transporter permease n=1 Tax=Allorhizocola rhizosphaerae TaxID=1872709 RepID=UPI000E3BF73C|nr:ABC transporter permease [Allorhizocola rhizosphaerae]
MSLRPARLAVGDVVRLAVAGVRARPLRVSLSALGVAIGIAAMLSVVGISASSRADLDRTLDRLGTNMLTVVPGTTLFGEAAVLPGESVTMIRRVGPVQSVSAVGRVRTASVYRNEHVPKGQSGGIAVLAARLDVLDTVRASMRVGSWLTPATEEFPAVVLGARAARRLGVALPGTRVWLGEQWFSLAGVLEPVPLAPELDTAALVGWPAAQRFLDYDGHPTTVFVRAHPDAVESVRSVLAATANPADPSEVLVSRPSDALLAQRAAGTAFGGLLFGLGAVALLVGGLGVANTMVVSVLERRSEIGLRRALGATKGQIWLQFVAESWLLSVLGGLAGLASGTAITAIYAALRGWPPALPGSALALAVAMSMAIGTLAGVYPATRAARLSPVAALGSA